MASRLPPSPRYPGIVMLYLSQRRTQRTLEKATARFGGAFTFRLIRGKTLVFVSSPDLVEAVFTADSNVLIADTHGIFLLGKHSVLSNNGDAHTAARQLIAPAFHREQVERYRAHMERVCDEEFARFPIGERFELFPRLERITLKLVLGIVFGAHTGNGIDEVSERFHEMIAFRENNPIIAAMINVAPPDEKPPEKFMKVRGAFDAEIYKQIERARNDPHVEERDDALALLLRTRHPDGTLLSDEEVRDHVATFLVQGHGSAASALAWSIERMTRHPEIYERLCAEARSDYSDNGEYLDAVITETLRLRPPVPVIARMAGAPFRFGEWELAPGEMILANALALHRREDLYPDPLAFRPERWLGQKPGTFTWIPFGGGERHCIGRTLATSEMRYVLHRMMREFEFELTDAPDEKMRRRGIGWIPADKAPVVIRERVPAPSPRAPVATDQPVAARPGNPGP